MSDRLPSLPRIVLLGNPNCGKTSLFNLLTGSHYKVANYPGVTVEKREGLSVLSNQVTAQLTDLPGTYSLQGESIDERVAMRELAAAHDLTVLVVDASNLERNLYLVSEVIDRGLPLVIALNMMDLTEKRGLKVLNARLSVLLDVPIIPIVALKRLGIEELKQTLILQLERKKISSQRFVWAQHDLALREISERDQSPLSDSEYSGVASARYQWIQEVMRQSTVQSQAGRNWSERVDEFVMHRYWGLVIFFLIMGFIFQSIYSWASYPMELIDAFIAQIGAWIGLIVPQGSLRSLLVDGILAGVGSVLIFIPQIALLFFFIGILEDSGYLCRAAFVMDRVMRKVGLQGRSFIPLLSSFACAIPGIMATRSIPSIADRFITILVAPLMSCSARLPVYTLLIAAFVPSYYVGGIFSLQGLVMFALYALGVLGAAVVAFILKRLLFIGEPTLFVMEMPPFRMPSLRLIFRDVWDRIRIFIRSAGSVILACSVVLWFLASHPLNEIGAAPVVKESYAGMLGNLIEPVIRPLGFTWEIGIGIIASFAAREVFVSTLATVYNLSDVEDTQRSLVELLQHGAQESGFSLAGALSLLVFYVFACQCMSTLAVCRRETGSWRWPLLMFVYMTVLAYGAAYGTFNLASFMLF
jgi:ferrous iron transport protein B